MNHHHITPRWERHVDSAACWCRPKPDVIRHPNGKVAGTIWDHKPRTAA